MKKKKNGAATGNGLLPIFSIHWVTIQQLYHDTEAGKAGLGERGWDMT